MRMPTKYAVVIHEEPEGGFWAEVPALPGCYSQGVVQVMKEQGSQPESNIQILDVAV